MYKNYLKVALRNLLRHKVYTFINITGLSVGIAFCLLILLFVKDEWSYDTFHPQADRIHRLAVKEITSDNQEYFGTSTAFVLAPVLKQSLPEIESTVRVATHRNLIRRGEAVFSENIHVVDTTFFQVFNFPLVKGNTATALKNPGTIVLTEETAKRIFGEEDPLGKPITVQLRETPYAFTVSAVAKNTPSNSSIRFDYLISFENAKNIWGERAFTSFYQVYGENYVKLTASGNINQIQQKLPAILKQHLGEDHTGQYLVLFQPITDIHLNTDFPEGLEPISDPAYSYILGTVALFVLLIASINFITLSLGRSIDRAREVGVRKVVGAVRQQLILQFWGEAVLVSLLALVLGLALTTLALPVFNELAGKKLSYSLFSTITLTSLLLAFVVGLLAGIYPALFLSNFNPVAVLKGRLQVGDANLYRRFLIGFQFMLSIGLIICTLVMSQQLRFLQNKNLGFDKEQVIIIPTGVGDNEALRIFDRMKNNLQNHPAIAEISHSVFAIGEGWMEADYRDNTKTVRPFMMNIVDVDFLKTMKAHLVAGRDFSREITSDISQGIIVNEALVKEYGWKDPLGQRLPGPNFPAHQIIGVVADFNYESLHTPVKPLVLALSDSLLRGADNVMIQASSRRKIMVRVKPGNLQTTVSLLEQTWKKDAPNLPFNYSFVDETINNQYQRELRLGQMMNYATSFAIFISCMGLFSLATLAVQKRRREIGVRKIMGASLQNIVLMFSKEFALLVLFAFLVATPIAYYVMQKWLQDFEYQVAISPWIFLLAGVLSLAIALITVSYQVIKAALANPVDALRSE
ncbi:ABC transporter permease [Rhodocytophaga aerolata]|uniref:ABC transporter permease n=1 Tax=Rhodocytophaga aerolata TaxID=455078 RepID=A0ABT8R1Q5_9BACT|nr:ABC transporter permease [Rhodocytophaga aerolata]MDO1446031.1 ABC transporter permease [Rhodocytophaga aerolata]